MRESYLEKKLKDDVLKMGGQALKFISPGKNGVPDRLILKPGGQALFVEMKAPGEPLEPLQRKRAEQLRALGFKVYKIDSVEDVKRFIQEEFENAN